MHYVMMTLTNVGFGIIYPSQGSTNEIVLTLCMLVLGTILFIHVITRLESIVAQVDVASTLHQRRADCLSSWAESRRLPAHLQRRLSNYYELLWVHQKGVTITEAMAYLPRHLQTKLRAEMCGISIDAGAEMMHDIPGLNRLHLRHVHQLLANAGHLECMDMEVIFYCGEVPMGLHFVMQGTVELCSELPNAPGNVSFATIQGDEGSTPTPICASNFMLSELQSCTAIAKSWCRIIRFDRIQLDNLRKDYPNLATGSVLGDNRSTRCARL